jgi:hypothetical protein
VQKIIGRVYNPEAMRLAQKHQLESAIEILEQEIKINESCQIRTEENEAELRKLYDAKCRCKQRISIIKEESE